MKKLLFSAAVYSLFMISCNWSNEIPEKNKGVSKLSYHQNW